MNHRLAILATAGTFFIFSSSVHAHHGLNSYRTERIVTVKGTVTEFEFINPHTLVHIAVKESNGAVENWTAETAPPAMLRKIGWDRMTLNPGDPVTVSGYPAKDGSKVLSVRRIVLPNGQELNEAPR